MADNVSIVLHPAEPRVLLVAGNEGWGLPVHTASEAPDIRQEMRARYGLDTTVLGTVGGRFLDEERDEASAIFALEAHGPPGSLPSDARWVGGDELARLPLARPDERAVIEQRMREARGEPPPAQRVPWARTGWLDTATAWIHEQLAGLGVTAVGGIAQVRIRPWSAVLRATTDMGDVYFKAVAPAFAFEAPLTKTLAELWSTHTPRVLATDSERRWLLMADAGGALRPALMAGGDPAPYEAALGEFARFQAATVPHVERLLALGCPDRRLARLPALYTRVLDDCDTLLVGQAGGPSEEEYARLRGAATELSERCARLAGYGVPPAALHHDEITPGHVIAASGGGYIFFAWGDSGITHPLCSLMMVLRWARLVLHYDTVLLARLRDAYLSPWAAYEPLERLREAASLASRLALLCRALTWYEFIKQVEPGARWEFDDSAAYFLGLFLKGEE